MECQTFDQNNAVMWPKKESRQDYEDGDDLNLEVIEDIKHLDVDVIKHKSALGKRGAIALRRKPSRKSRRSQLSSNNDVILQDCTEAMRNGHADELSVDAEDEYELSPSTKKPIQNMALPLHGMAGKSPSLRTSSTEQDDEDNTMNTASSEAIRLHKPHPGAFVLPNILALRHSKLQRPQSETTEKTSVENKPAAFKIPVLKYVKPVEKGPSREPDCTPVLSRARLRSIEGQKGEKKVSNENVDNIFKKPTLRSALEQRRDKSPAEKINTEPVMMVNDNANELNCDADEGNELSALAKKPSQAMILPGHRTAGSSPFQRKLSLDHDVDNKQIHTSELTKSSTPPRGPSLLPINTRQSKLRRSLSDASDNKPVVFKKPILKSVKERVKPKVSEKPDLLQKVANTHAKALEVMHTKEVKTEGAETSLCLEKSHSQSLKYFTNSQSTSSRHLELRNIEDSWKRVTTPRQRNASVGSEHEHGSNRTSVTTDSKPVVASNGNGDKLNGDSDDICDSSVTPNKPIPLPGIAAIPKSHKKSFPENNDSENAMYTKEFKRVSKPSPGDIVLPSNGTRPSKLQRSQSDVTEKSKPVIFKKPVLKSVQERVKPKTSEKPEWHLQAANKRSSFLEGSTISSPSLNGLNEVPKWRRELAQRRKSRKDTSLEEIPKKDGPVEPDWRKEIHLRKLRNTAKNSDDSAVHGNTD
ncbi:uncharacterized protein LOC123532167 isoform X2 [Mercenaria mercenaria]|uniref:uncharacterized protein LOC123532167 isoform X2 n=1 Tax=Mercenaria mercenaria TaxID=6596 RepID=UPI00234EB65D|nr:uncharacterized protein LOC123532167 isoform X2 [Mercenaria mercenaria]